MCSRADELKTGWQNLHAPLPRSLMMNQLMGKLVEYMCSWSYDVFLHESISFVVTRRLVEGFRGASTSVSHESKFIASRELCRVPFPRQILCVSYICPLEPVWMTRLRRNKHTLLAAEVEFFPRYYIIGSWKSNYSTVIISLVIDLPPFFRSANKVEKFWNIFIARQR